MRVTVPWRGTTTSRERALHLIEQHGHPRAQRVHRTAADRLPWREAEERGGYRDGLNR